MKWRLFQTKMINSFLLADIFAIGTQDFRKGMFSGIKPRALITIENGKLKWLFSHDYWRQLEGRSNKVLDTLGIKFVESSRQLMEKDFKRLNEKLLSNIALELKIEAIAESSRRIIGIFLGPFESILPPLIAEELDGKLSSFEIEKIVSKITQPERLTFRGKYQRDLYSGAKRIIQSVNQREKIATKLCQKYAILPIDISGKPWLIDHFYNELDQIVFEHNLDEIEKEILSQQKSIKQIKRNKEKLFLKLNASTRLRYLAVIAGEMSLLRDFRKTLIGAIMVHLHSIMAQIAQKTELPLEDLYQYSVSELSLLLRQNKIVGTDSIDQRKIMVAITVSEENIKYFSGAKAEKFISRALKINKSARLIRGTVGSLGKTVVGKVRIVLTQEDLVKMEPGDVMVSIATNYDLVPGMGKAVAIVTDEGGILSHAAVVSRELGIPCLIATKNASQVLSDGDEVKVDTKNGLVRILEKVEINV